jgi:hypothetical protein
VYQLFVRERGLRSEYVELLEALREDRRVLSYGHFMDAWLGIGSGYKWWAGLYAAGG